MLLPQAEEPTVPMVNVRICGISTTVPQVWHDWVLHLAHCKLCYHTDRASNIQYGPCLAEKELHRKLDELNNSRSEHVT